MNFLNRIFRPRTEARAAATAVPSGPPDQVGVYQLGGFSDTGVNVNEMVALTASAVYSAVAVISNAIAALPCHVLMRDGGEKQYAHPVARLLAGEPNEYQTSPAWRENMLLQLLLWGNCYSFIERDELGQPTALLPLRSDRTRPYRTPAGLLRYATLVGGATFELEPQDVFHVANLSIDGITGLSPIQLAKQNVGLSIALERFAARFFGQGCAVGGVLSVPSLKSEGMKEFARKFRENYTGPENAWKIPVLENGMTFTPLTVDPEKSQALGQRVHQLREVARIYRVPPHKIGDLERATFSNIEHQSLEFVTDCLMPWVIKLEAEANRKLFLEREKPTLEVKFNMDALLRADTAARYAAHATGINAGFLKINEARAKEGLPPVEGGDVLRTPLNMAPAAGPATPPAKSAEEDKAAARDLVEDQLRRVLTKEAHAITRGFKKFAGKPAELRQWAEGWYRTHERLVARVVAPAFAAAGLTVTPDDYAKRHVADSLTAIGAAIDVGSDPADLGDDFTDIRPADCINAIFNDNTPTGGEQ